MERSQMKQGSLKEARSCVWRNGIEHLASETRKNDENLGVDETETKMVKTLPSSLITKERSRPGTWMIDTASTRHMVDDHRCFLASTPSDGEVQIGNNETIASLGVGRIEVCFVVKGVQHYTILHNVVYAPDIIHNLIAVIKVRKRKLKIIIGDNENCLGMEKVEMLHEPFNEVKTLGLETREGLFGAAIGTASAEFVFVALNED